MSVLLFASLWALAAAAPGALGWYAGARFDRDGLRGLAREWTLVCGAIGAAGVVADLILGGVAP